MFLVTKIRHPQFFEYCRFFLFTVLLLVTHNKKIEFLLVSSTSYAKKALQHKLNKILYRRFYFVDFNFYHLFESTKLPCLATKKFLYRLNNTFNVFSLKYNTSVHIYSELAIPLVSCICAFG